MSPLVRSHRFAAVLLGLLCLAGSLMGCSLTKKQRASRKASAGRHLIPDSIELEKGKTVSRYYLAGRVEAGRYKSFHIPDALNYTEREIPAGLAARLADKVADSLAADPDGRVGLIDRTPTVSTPINDLLLQLAIVELVQKEALGTTLVVEMKVAEARGGRAVAFARHSVQTYGHTVGFENPLEDAVNRTARDLARFLHKILGGATEKL